MAAMRASVDAALLLQTSSYTRAYEEVNLSAESTLNGCKLVRTLVTPASVLVHVYSAPARHICLESLLRPGNARASCAVQEYVHMQHY